MSKRKLAYQFAGGVIGLVSLNLAFTPSASAGGTPPASYPSGSISSGGNCSNCSGTNNGSNASGYYQYYPGCSSNCGYYEYIPFNGSNSSGFNASNASGSGFYISYTNQSNGSGVKFYPTQFPNKTNCSNCDGKPTSEGFYQYFPGKGNKPGYFEFVSFNGSNSSGYNASNASGSGYYISYYTNESNGSGVKFYPYTPPKTCDGGSGCTGPDPGPGTGRDPDPVEKYTDREAQERAGYVIGLGNSKTPGFYGALGNGVSNYGASSAGLSKQIMELLNAASADYADKSAKLAAIESQATPSAKKDDPVRYSRVADANADCGCNASASAPDNSVELAAAKKAEAEAAASLAKAQQQAREFLEAHKKAGTNIANGTQFSPIW
jgi:hypothetical protein